MASCTRPVLSRESVRRVALEDVIHCFFDGSEESLRHYLQTRATRNGVAMRQRDPTTAC